MTVVPWAFAGIPFGSKESLKDLFKLGSCSGFPKLIRIPEVGIALALALCRLGVAIDCHYWVTSVRRHTGVVHDVQRHYIWHARGSPKLVKYIM